MFKPQDEEVLYNTAMLNLKTEEKLSIYYNMRLLLVDDNKLNIKVAKKALADFNFKIDEAYDGKQAVELVKENKYDIIFMDIMMPVMSGETALVQMMNIPGFDTPVIALTADRLNPLFLFCSARIRKRIILNLYFPFKEYSHPFL